MTDIPVLGWFDQIPQEHQGRWLTRNQLAQEGLRPKRGAQPVARVEWRRRRGTGFALLYDKDLTEPKPAATPAQLAALEKARTAQQTCPYCKTDVGFVLPHRWTPADCWSCAARRLDDDRNAAIQRARDALAAPETVVLDLETTDLDGFVVEIAIVDTTGAELFNRRVNPQDPISPEAQRVHGISEGDVAGAPTFADLVAELGQVLEGRRVLTYNAAFDSRILGNELQRLDRAWKAFAPHLGAKARREWGCIMELYAQYVGEWSARYEDYRMQPLPGGDHSALGDARAALAVLRLVAETFREREMEP